MSANQARGIVLSSFVAGVLFVMAVVSPWAWDPVAEPEPLTASPKQIADDPAAARAAIAIVARSSDPVLPLVAIEEPSPAPVPVSPPPERIAAVPDPGVRIVLDLNARSRTPSPPPSQPKPAPSLGSAPIPGETWNNPDAVNWSTVPAADVAPPAPPRDDRPLTRLIARRQERSRLRIARREEQQEAEPRLPERFTPGSSQWPTPHALVEAFAKADAEAGREPHGPQAARDAWVRTAGGLLEAVLATNGPKDLRAGSALIALGDSVREGLAAADADPDATRSAETRRIALAIARRVVVWRAAAALFQDAGSPDAAPQERAAAEYSALALLDAIERFEIAGAAEDAVTVTSSANELAATRIPAAHALAREVQEHYRAANVRVSVHRDFLDRFMPPPAAEHGPVDEVILGRRVRGSRTVKRSTTVDLKPDPASVSFELRVAGDIDSHTCVESGPVSVKTRSLSSFIVRQPVRLTPEGLKVGRPQAEASAKARNHALETSFDSVPIMRSVVRNIAESQHEEAMPEATREMLARIVMRSRHQMEEQSGPRLSQLEENVRCRLWQPVVRMGLEPTPLGLETSQTATSVRLRLAAGDQLSGHSPRPRPPASAIASVQVHESSINNAAERLGIAGRLLDLREMVALVRNRLAIEGPLSEDLPDDVQVQFAATEPIRVTAEDGLVKIRVAIDLLESGRRSWEGIVATVAYRPKVSGLQVLLEREGVVQLSGENQRGRFEIALRAVFGKVFQKEKPLALVPQQIVDNPRMRGLEVVQAAATDGWIAMSIGPPAGRPAAAAARAASGPRARRF